MKKRTKKGFTLIELIVVIAILAILAIIAIPVVSGVVDDANQAAADANARTLELGIKAVMTKENATSTSDIKKSDALTFIGLTSDTQLTEGGKYNFTVASDGSVTGTYSKTAGDIGGTFATE
ncbi:MAG: prepilin-type N-terminal cleavage/methylation domain-containing protein [Eubacteriales bacterium]|nr:prepilin-type N-terminal cleavage/methylation domain-containing protein [Eubacteriales bacterium]